MSEWLEILSSHKLLKAGFRQDLHIREESLSRLDLPSIFQTFKAATQTSHNVDVTNDAHADKFKKALNSLPRSIVDLMYNAGSTNFLTSENTENIVEKFDPLNDREAGQHFDSCLCIVTRADEQTEKDFGISHTTLHEIGHNLSVLLAQAIPKPENLEFKEILNKAFQQDMKMLSNSNIEIPPEVLKGIDKAFLSGGGNPWKGIVSWFIHSENPQEGLFPSLTNALKELGIYNNPNFMIEKISDHSEIKAAFSQDLKMLRSYSPSDEVFLDTDKGQISAKNGKTLAVQHFLSRREEAFAEVFANLLDPNRNPEAANDLARYMPNLASEIEEIIQAIESIHNADPEIGPKSSRDTAPARRN